MSNIINIDGFDNPNFHLSEITGNPTISNGRYDGKCLCLKNNDSYTKNLNNNYSTLIAGIALKTGSFANTEKSLIRFRFDNFDQTVLRLKSNGILKVTKDNGGATIDQSSTSLNINEWYYIEFKTTFSSTTNGNIVVKVNGLDWINTKNVITTGTSGHETANKIRLGDANNNPWQIYFDDFYLDTSNFHGPHVKIHTISTEKNKYIKPSPNNLNWLPEEGIKAIQLTATTEKDSQDSTNLSFGIDSYLSPNDISINKNYSKISELWEINPNTNTLWNPKDIQNSKFITNLF